MKRMMLAIALFAAAAPALAAEVNFSTVLKGVDGKPLQECTDVDQTGAVPRCVKFGDLTLGHMSAGALNLKDQRENLTWQQIVARGTLAQRLYGGGKQTVDADDVSLIKSQLAKTTYNALEITSAVQLLDPDSLKKPEPAK